MQNLLADQVRSVRFVTFTTSTTALGIWAWEPRLYEKKVQQTDPDSSKDKKPGGVTLSVYYRNEDLLGLAELEQKSGINAREWCRTLLRALLESWRARGAVTLPIAVVPAQEVSRLASLEADRVELERIAGLIRVAPDLLYRELLDALLASWRQRGALSLPIVVVPREDSESGGLSEPK